MTQALAEAVYSPRDNLQWDDVLRIRQQGIGGSDVAAIVGLAGDPGDVWLDKIGAAEDDDDHGTLAALGHYMEPFTAALYEAETDFRLGEVPMLRNRAEPWIQANPDRLAVAAPGEGTPILVDGAATWWRHGFEIKHPHFKGWRSWKRGEPPLKFRLQCLWYMIATGLREWHLAALVYSDDLKVHLVEYDEEAADALVNEAGEFWHDYVLTGTPPPPGRTSSEALLRHLYPRVESEIRDATDEERRLAYEIEALKDRRKTIEALRKDKEHALKRAIGDAEGVRFNGGRVLYPERRGRVSYSKLVKHLGIDEETQEAFRGESTRTLDVKIDDD